jgi:hypothetical protein
VAATLALAGCGQTKGPEVATAQGSTVTASGSPTSSGSATSSAPAKESAYDKARRYIRCMNDNGDNLPDPVEGKSLPMGTIGDAQGPTEAYNKCKKFLPATWPVKLDPKEIARSAKFFECMRKEGIPVPVADENGMIDEPPGDPWQTMPGYREAEAACRHLYDDPANNANQ